jgi:hypothetical protein
MVSRLFSTGTSLSLLGLVVPVRIGKKNSKVFNKKKLQDLILIGIKYLLSNA